MVMKLSSFEKKALNNMVQNFSLEDLMRVIDELSIVAWDQKMQRPSLESWLSNFTGKVFGDDNKEKILALLILMNYTYYSEKEVRELCKCSYNAFIHEMLHESCQTDDISSSISEIINTTYFSPLGNPSESGCTIAYLFRQENDISLKRFSPNAINDSKYRVFIDDVTLSGNQVTTYLNDVEVDEENTILILLIASETAINYIHHQYPYIKIINPVQLDERSRCFTEESFLFSSKEMHDLLPLAKKLCEEYDAPLSEYGPFGYDGGAYLFGFYYNTPNNTLPIIWSKENGWKPAFERHTKKYSQENKSRELNYV